MLKEIKSRLICIQQDLDSIQEMLEGLPEENSGRDEEDLLESYQLVREDPDTGYLYYERGYERVKEKQ